MTLQAVENPRSDADRRSVFAAAVAEWIQRRREEKLSPTDIGKLAPELRFATLLSGRALNAIRFVREHPFEACHWAVLEIITVLSDNERGSAQVSVRGIAEILSRSQRAIFDAIAWLKENGFIADSAIPGKLTIRWPVVPGVALMASDPKAIPLALSRQIGPLKDTFRGGGQTPEGYLQGSGSTHEGYLQGSGKLPQITRTKNSMKSMGEPGPLKVEAPTYKERKKEEEKTPGDGQLEFDRRKVFAQEQIQIAPSGRLILGPELQAELKAAGYTAEQIRAGTDKTLAKVSTTNKVTILNQVWQQVANAKTYAPSGPQRITLSTGKELPRQTMWRNGKPSL